MNRHVDWAVIVCLVGGGQEIHTGEAGISEWIESLNRSFPDWHIYISSRLTDSEYAAGGALAQLIANAKSNGALARPLGSAQSDDEAVARPSGRAQSDDGAVARPSGRAYEEIAADTPKRHVILKDDLHLAVSMRSFRAENLSRLVKELLDLEAQAAFRTLLELREKYPIVLTRDLMKAKRWLRTHAPRLRTIWSRCLVASRTTQAIRNRREVASQSDPLVSPRERRRTLFILP